MAIKTNSLFKQLPGSLYGKHSSPISFIYDWKVFRLSLA